MPLSKPELVGATEVDITVQFNADASLSYELQWKEHAESWDQHMKKTSVSGSGKTEAVATPLNPGATYCVRLVCNGETSPELIVDTEQVGCTPTPDKKSCCIVM